VRLEVPVTTGLRFHDDPLGYVPPNVVQHQAKTVGIEFRGRVLVWHEIPPSPAQPPFPAFTWGPTVTVVYHDPADRDAAADDLGRFLSALVFHTEVVIAAVPTFFRAGSGESDPYRRPVAREPQHERGTMTLRAPERIEVEGSDRLALALAVYREGVCATPYLGFFAFWGVLDAVFDGSDADVDAYVNRESAKLAGGIEQYVRAVMPQWAPPTDQTIAKYLREHGRNAIGHVVRDRQYAPHVNPDDNSARLRLAAEAYWLRAAGRRAILERWPSAVRAVERP
jgi:hypothetical protein